MGGRRSGPRGRPYFKDHPIIGVGAGNFEEAEGQYSQELGRSGKWSAAHNPYLQAFVELGTTGGALFIAIILLTARIALRSYRPRRQSPRLRRRTRAPPPLERPELLAGLAAFATGAYFLSHAYFTPLYALLGLVSLSGRVVEAEAVGAPAGPSSPGGPSPFRNGYRGGLAHAAHAHHGI